MVLQKCFTIYCVVVHILLIQGSKMALIWDTFSKYCSIAI